jgi:glycosyltransferase involved in cell wall biosynthesis
MTAAPEPIDILLVEDNPDDVLMTRRALRETGLPAVLHVVHDGQEAMDYLRRAGAYQQPASSPRPGLVLLDINLPRLGGLEVLAQIKSDERLRRIPVIMLTVSRRDEDVVKSYDIGCNSFLLKPGEFDQFVDLIKELERYWGDCNVSAPSTPSRATTLSVVIPCYNEARTLRQCVAKLLTIADPELRLELIIVDDGSTDGSVAVARELARRHPQILIVQQPKNQGKGAALREGFRRATGDFVAVQDADLEYDPEDLKRLLGPLRSGKADVVLGSRYLSSGARRALYFWHSMGNAALTLLSNMLTDTTLTDIETGYKVFRREVIQRVTIEEDRFGFEPEIVAKLARMRLRIYEMSISYYGRTYAEGKKIGIKDLFRTLYCIFRYSAHWAPWPLQLGLYTIVGGLATIINWGAFTGFVAAGWSVGVAALAAFFVAAWANYWLCISLLFRHRARWSAVGEVAVFLLLVAFVGAVDWFVTTTLVAYGVTAGKAKLLATGMTWIMNFAGRRWIVFPEQPLAPWKPQEAEGASGERVQRSSRS